MPSAVPMFRPDHIRLVMIAPAVRANVPEHWAQARAPRRIVSAIAAGRAEAAIGPAAADGDADGVATAMVPSASAPVSSAARCWARDWTRVRTGAAAA